MRRARGSPIGASGVTRTPDLLITNQLLYRLSYTSVCLFGPDGLVYFVYVCRDSCPMLAFVKNTLIYEDIIRR